MGKLKTKVLNLSLAFTFIAAAIFPLLTSTEVKAASAPKLPIKWTSNDHANAVDANGTVYYPRGYVCNVVIGSQQILSDDGTSVVSKPTAGTSNDGFSNSETASSPNVTVQLCTSSAVAAYVWTTEPDGGDQYALIISAKSGYMVDTKLERITGANTSLYSSIWKLNSGRYASGTPTVRNTGAIAVDTKLQKLVKDSATNPGTTTDDQPTCYNSDIGPLGWIICPIADAVDGMANFVEAALKKMLSIEPSTYGEGQKVNPLKTAWSSMRIIATLGLVGVALFMILSQIFSFDLVSAYTIKKVLPRLVIATILIQLSWFMFTGLIVITNTVGNVVADIMYAPFGGANSVGDITAILGDFFNKNTGASAVVGGATVAAAAGGIITAAVVGFGAVGAAAIAAGPALGLYALSIALIVGLAIFVGITVLVLRMVVIIALLVVSPLALLAWILPNTQNIWQKWWSLFSKLLIMYPLIIAILSAGKIMAWIIANSNWSTATGLLAFFILIIAYYGPFFLIPATFSFAGGVFAKAVGAVDGYGKKAQGSNLFGLKTAKQRRSESRDYNRKQKGINLADGGGKNKFTRSKYGRAYGRYKAGSAGATGAYAAQLRAKEEQEAMQNTGLEYNNATKGMEFGAQVDDSEKIAMAMAGTTYTLSNGNKVQITESMQRNAAKFLADTGRSEQLRRVEGALLAPGSDGKNREDLWNTIQGENAGKITGINPDQVGKAFETLSASELSGMKPASFRNLRAKMADPGVSDEAKNAMRTSLEALKSDPMLFNKLGEDAREDVNAVLDTPQGQTVSRRRKIQEVTVDGVKQEIDLGEIDYGGRSEYLFDKATNQRGAKNPEFGIKHIKAKDSNGKEYLKRTDNNYH